MLETKPELDKSINNAKEMAKERQPIRADVYLIHMKYRESQIEQLKMIIKELQAIYQETPKFNYNLQEQNPPLKDIAPKTLSDLNNVIGKALNYISPPKNRYINKYTNPNSGLGSINE